MPSGEATARNWAEIRKGGGLSPSIESISKFLAEDAEMLSREELINRINEYFNECIERIYDADTCRYVDAWRKAPTKAGLARKLGITTQVLIDYCNGTNSNGIKYSDRPDYKRVVANDDFPIVRKAVALIEEFYESQLPVNKNNAGTIFWLKNARGSNWTDDKTLLINEANTSNRQSIMSAEVDAKKLQDKYKSYLVDSEEEAKDV